MNEKSKMSGYASDGQTHLYGVDRVTGIRYFEKKKRIEYRTHWESGHQTWEPATSFPEGANAFTLKNFRSMNRSKVREAYTHKDDYEKGKRKVEKKKSKKKAEKEQEQKKVQKKEENKPQMTQEDYNVWCEQYGSMTRSQKKRIEKYLEEANPVQPPSSSTPPEQRRDSESPGPSSSKEGGSGRKKNDNKSKKMAKTDGQKKSRFRKRSSSSSSTSSTSTLQERRESKSSTRKPVPKRSSTPPQWENPKPSSSSTKLTSSAQKKSRKDESKSPEPPSSASSVTSSSSSEDQERRTESPNQQSSSSSSTSPSSSSSSKPVSTDRNKNTDSSASSSSDGMSSSKKRVRSISEESEDQPSRKKRNRRGWRCSSEESLSGQDLTDTASALVRDTGIRAVEGDDSRSEPNTVPSPSNETAQAREVTPVEPRTPQREVKVEDSPLENSACYVCGSVESPESLRYYNLLLPFLGSVLAVNMNYYRVEQAKELLASKEFGLVCKACIQTAFYEMQALFKTRNFELISAQDQTAFDAPFRLVQRYIATLQSNRLIEREFNFSDILIFLAKYRKFFRNNLRVID